MNAEDDRSKRERGQNLPDPPPQGRLWLWLAVIALVLIIVVIVFLVPLFERPHDENPPERQDATPPTQQEGQQGAGEAQSEAEPLELPSGGPTAIQTH